MVGRPCVHEAAVRVPAVEQFTPNGGDLKVVFNATYLRQTMEGHPAGAYLDLQEPLSLTFGAEQAGGLSSPNSAVKTITSRAGVVPDVFDTDASGVVVGAKDIDTIRNAFGGAQLLGIDLGKYLKGLVKDNFDTLRQLGDEQIAAILKDANSRLPAPVLRIRDLADGQGKELRYVWKPPLEPPKTPGNKPDPNALIDVSKASLILDARTVRSKDAVDRATVDGKLSHFAMNFFGMARVEFDELKFSTGPGKKPDVTASGVELKFSNELEFLNSLRAALPADVFGSGAFLDIQPSGIRVGYKLAVPDIPLGVFMLSNLALSAEVAIPFDNKPVSFRFSVSEQKHPFNVTVSLFGGGGYFSMLVDTSGVKEVEGALEFGGSAALDLGVASGGVSIMAGIHFLFADGDVTLAGYLRCNGFLTVLGIVTVSVEFYLELSYEKHDGQSVVRGRGTLTVSVRIAFFSKSVTLELERSFSGAPGDPTVAQCISKSMTGLSTARRSPPEPRGDENGLRTAHQLDRSPRRSFEGRYAGPRVGVHRPATGDVRQDDDAHHAGTELPRFPFLAGEGQSGHLRFRYRGPHFRILDALHQRSEAAGTAPDTDLWKSLFGRETPLEPYVFEDHTDPDKFHTYSANEVGTFTKERYVEAAKASPETPPSTRALLRSVSDTATGTRDVATATGDLAAEDEPAMPPQLNGLKGFHTLNMTPAPTLANGEPIRRPRPPKQDPDFHQMLTSLGDHPKLLRALGLVLDFVLPANLLPVSSGQRVLTVTPNWAPALGNRSHDVAPRTRYVFLPDRHAFVPAGKDLTDEEPLPPPSRGLVAVTKNFAVEQADIDAAARKMISPPRTPRDSPRCVPMGSRWSGASAWTASRTISRGRSSMTAPSPA